jgi:hypothetical protein
MLYQSLANLVLITHIAFVLFVVGGQILIFVGGLPQLRIAQHPWQWVRKAGFRYLHLAAIVYVVIESWLGVVCPLTVLEQWLRQAAGQTTYQGDFIAYYLSDFLFFNAPAWVFTCAYSVFGGLVILSFFLIPIKKSASTKDVNLT